MYTIVHDICDALFPPSEDARIVRGLTEDMVCERFSYRDERGMFALSSFHDACIRALIHEAKFHRNKKAFSLLGTLFFYYIETKKPLVDMVIPIPLSNARFRTRGYNQVEKVLTTCGNTLPFPIATDVLTRTRHTRPQTELTRTERLVNLQDAFHVTHGERITGKHILLLDDVLTTGATLHSAKHALLPYGASSITCVSLAH